MTIGVIVHFNRCLYCGRQTPHEVCHRHSTSIHGDKVRYPGDGYPSYNDQPEVCDDEACPQKATDWQ